MNWQKIKCILICLELKDEGGVEGRQRLIMAVITLAIIPNSRWEYLSKVE